MDIRMPKMNGLEAARTIRANGFAKLPVIAMTAHAFSDDVERSLDAGMNGHLTKPVNPNILNEILLKWIPSKDRKTSRVPLKRTDIEASTADLLPNLAGLDIELGLSQTGVSTKKYLEVLYKFVLRNKDLADKIRHSMKNNSREAEAAAHSVKGASALLGIKTLSEIASDLERKLHDNNHTEAEKLFTSFKKELEHICSGLLDFFKNNSDITVDTNKI
jgi:CheY-like chemotaxis protein